MKTQDNVITLSPETIKNMEEAMGNVANRYFIKMLALGGIALLSKTIYGKSEAIKNFVSTRCCPQRFRTLAEEPDPGHQERPEELIVQQNTPPQFGTFVEEPVPEHQEVHGVSVAQPNNPPQLIGIPTDNTSPPNTLWQNRTVDNNRGAFTGISPN